jgi:hypothetical protein
MVKSVKIDPGGSPVSIKVSYTGMVIASYEYQLWDAINNLVLVSKIGNNQNPDDDSYKLPLPAGSNVGRLIDVRSSIVPLDTGTSRQYSVRVEVFQDEKLDEAVDSGELIASGTSSQIYIKLVA